MFWKQPYLFDYDLVENSINSFAVISFSLTSVDLLMFHVCPSVVFARIGLPFR